MAVLTVVVAIAAAPIYLYGIIIAAIDASTPTPPSPPPPLPTLAPTPPSPLSLLAPQGFISYPRGFC